MMKNDLLQRMKTCCCAEPLQVLQVRCEMYDALHRAFCSHARLKCWPAHFHLNTSLVHAGSTEKEDVTETEIIDKPLYCLPTLPSLASGPRSLMEKERGLGEWSMCRRECSGFRGKQRESFASRPWLKACAQSSTLTSLFPFTLTPRNFLPTQHTRAA